MTCEWHPLVQINQYEYQTLTNPKGRRVRFGCMNSVHLFEYNNHMFKNWSCGYRCSTNISPELNPFYCVSTPVLTFQIPLFVQPLKHHCCVISSLLRNHPGPVMYHCIAFSCWLLLKSRQCLSVFLPSGVVSMLLHCHQPKMQLLQRRRGKKRLTLQYFHSFCFYHDVHTSKCIKVDDILWSNLDSNGDEMFIEKAHVNKLVRDSASLVHLIQTLCIFIFCQALKAIWNCCFTALKWPSKEIYCPDWGLWSFDWRAAAAFTIDRINA